MKTSVWLLVFFLSMNAFAGALYGLNVDDHMGVSPDPGGTGELAEAQADAANVQASGGGGQTLFSAYNSLASGVQAVIFTLLPATRLLANAGVPNAIVNWLTTAVPIIVGLDYAGFFRGSFLS
jgi:hypothetical protein